MRIQKNSLDDNGADFPRMNELTNTALDIIYR